MDSRLSAVGDPPKSSWTSWASSAGSSQSKLATSVADRIVQDIISRGWPVGQVLGSEPELLERYGVSRAVFREAVRLVEHQQIVRMRRGPGGGLMITAPTIDAIADAVQLTLYWLDARLDEVFDAREILEGLAVRLVPDHLDERRADRLRAIVAGERSGAVRDHREIHAALATSTGNPAIELFVDLLNRITGLYFSDTSLLTSQTLDAAHHAHARIVEAVVAGDGDLACSRMERHLRAEATFLREHGSTSQLIDPAVVLTGHTEGKKAEEVAREILRSVVERKSQPGDLLGSEGDLMERFAVSRAIIREAVQLLEHYDIAAMRRGPGGGLIVLEPSITAVTDVIALYLEYHGIQVADVFELRVGIEMALVDLAIDAMDPTRSDQLHEALENERGASDELFKEAAQDLHAVIASVAGNRVLELVSVVLIRLSRMHEGGDVSSLARRSAGTEVTRAHEAIVEGLVGGDKVASRRRMRRHLQELSTFYD